MKKRTRYYISILLLFALPLYTVAQKAQKAKEAKDSVLTAANLKTGNSQDVLISFFQIAGENLFGDNKSFKFQSSLFAIKAKTNEALWIDTAYVKERFARNFVITLNPALDSNYKFKSNTIGFKYAIVNNRDKTVFDFSKPDDWVYLQIQRSAIEKYFDALGRDSNNKNYKLAVNFFVPDDESGEKETAEKDLPGDFKKILRTEMSFHKKFSFSTLDSFRKFLPNEYKNTALYVENRGLWTVESNFSSLADGRLFSGINFSSEYLKGMLKNNSKMNLELDIKGSFDLADDTTTTTDLDLNRKILKLESGFNWIIAKNKNLKSIVELKGSIAYNNILSGAYTDEEKSKFTAEGTLRFRITDDLWIPLDIKYDPGNGKIFGFITAKFNFDWLKGKSAK